MIINSINIFVCILSLYGWIAIYSILCYTYCYMEFVDDLRLRNGVSMKIKVLGITLQDFGLRESLRQTDLFLKNGALNTIAYVSAQKLVHASENEDEKSWMEELDMIVCEDADVLHAAGITSRSRMREVEQNEYLIELLRRIKHNKYTTYLFTDTNENLNTLEDELHEIMSNLPIKGRTSLEEYSDNTASIINAMNTVAPTVIISRFPYPKGMCLMHEYKRLLNAEVWITLPNHINALKKRTLLKRLEQKINRRQLVRKVNHFLKEDEIKREDV